MKVVNIFILFCLEGCPTLPCGPFSYCNKTNNSCYCETGFKWNEQSCIGKYNDMLSLNLIRVHI